MQVRPRFTFRCELAGVTNLNNINMYHIYVHVYTGVCIYASMHVHVCMCAFMCACMYMYVCLYAGVVYMMDACTYFTTKLGFGKLGLRDL